MKQQTQLVIWKKAIRSKKSNMLWLAYQEGQIFEKFKAKENFIDMIKNLGFSKSTITFKIYIVKFVNKYPRMRKSSLFLHFLKNNFKMIKEICHENASEFKLVQLAFFNKYLYFKIDLKTEEKAK